MDDLISRQDAIDAVKKNTFRLTFAEEQNCEGNVAWSAYAVYSDVMEGALVELPSAEPEIIRCKDCIWHLKNDSCARLYCITDDDFYCFYGQGREDDKKRSDISNKSEM